MRLKEYCRPRKLFGSFREFLCRYAQHLVNDLFGYEETNLYVDYQGCFAVLGDANCNRATRQVVAITQVDFC
jgi:hypothetical protein